MRQGDKYVTQLHAINEQLSNLVGEFIADRPIKQTSQPDMQLELIRTLHVARETESRLFLWSLDTPEL